MWNFLPDILVLAPNPISFQKALMKYNFGIVHWVPEQLNIKAVTGACKLIDGCSLCSATPLVASYLAYATEIKSVQLHDSEILS